MEKPLSNCSFCGAFFVQPDYHREPSGACLDCFLWIWAKVYGKPTEWEELSGDEQYEALTNLNEVFRRAFSGLRHEGKA